MKTCPIKSLTHLFGVHFYDMHSIFTFNPILTSIALWHHTVLADTVPSLGIQRYGAGVELRRFVEARDECNDGRCRDHQFYVTQIQRYGNATMTIQR